VLHFLIEATILATKAVVFTFDGIKFKTDLRQLALGLAANFVRIFKALDIFGSWKSQLLSHLRDQCTEGRTFGEDLPFARFAAMASGNLRSQRIKEIFHFSTPLALCQLVAGSKGRCAAIWRCCIRRLRLLSKMTDLLVLK